jgi:TolB-like protein
MTGYTDSVTLSRLGQMLNADFVVSGHIRRLGNRNLIITTIVNVETFEQLAGDYREYRTIEEIPALMPAIASIIINASRQDTSQFPKLAVIPFNIANTGVNVQDAEVLAQILSIEIGNAEKYIVLPRTTAIQAAMKELEYQMSGATAEEGVKALGKAINAQYVLNVEVRRLGSTSMFTASILNVEDGSLLVGGYRNYRTITDGIQLMAELAGLLTDGGNTKIADVPAPTAEPPQKPTKEISPEANAAARLKTIGISVGSSLIDPLVITTVRGSFAPARYFYIELGADLGLISTFDDVEQYYSVYPFAHLGFFVPFAGKGGWYTGTGAGYMIGEYTFYNGGTAAVSVFAVDLTTGFLIGNVIDISYTLRAQTNFDSASNKISIGFVHRFK